MSAGLEKEILHQRLRFYDAIRVGRFVVEIHTDDHRIIDAIQSSLDVEMVRDDDRTPKDGGETRVLLRLSTRRAEALADLPSPDQATSSFETVELHVSHRATLLVVDRKSTVVIKPPGRVAEGFVSPEHVESPWIVAHRVFCLAVIELLRYHGAYYLHAGCVCHGGKGILITGASGGGKSTLTYALGRSGFAFLSDDGVFLDRDVNGLTAIAFPEKIKLDGASCSFFEELGHLRDVEGKRELGSKETGIHRFPRRTQPVTLLFPVRNSGPASEIHSISRHEALVRVLEQSIPSLERLDIQVQLDMLMELVDTCGCFELRAARDFDDIPELVAATVGG